MIQKLIFFIVAIAIIVVIPACQGGTKSSKGQSEKAEINKEQVASEVREFVYPLPTSFEVTEMLNRIEAAYIISLCNPVENVEKYLSEKSKALALGVYGADLSYSSTYNQKQQTVDYMNVSRQLVDDLDIASAIDPNIVKKLEENEGNKDKMVELITNTFYDTYEYLQQNERASVSMLVMAGSWIEALYIATHISEETFSNKEMVKIVMDQKAPLDKLMELLADFEGEAAIDETIALLAPLHTIYTSIEEGGITQQQMTDITNEVNIARHKLVE
jgi:hypothetical protein